MLSAAWLRKLCSRAVFRSTSRAGPRLALQSVKSTCSAPLPGPLFLPGDFLLISIRKQKELENQVSGCHKSTKPRRAVRL